MPETSIVKKIHKW